MVIKDSNMQKTLDLKIKQLKELVIKLHNVNKIQNDFSKQNVKESLTLGSKFNKLLKEILNSEAGIQELIKLMHDENPIVCFVISRNLFPLYPSETMSIMKHYAERIDDPLEKMRVNDVITGFESQQPVFMNQFKKLYNTDNLEELNREVKHKCI